MSKTNIRPGKYREEAAIILSNDELTAVVLPDRGAKIASLTYRRLDSIREILDQPPGDGKLRTVTYGSGFEGEDGSGFDDMFPNISSCTMEQPPWSGVELPDHGEVWSCPSSCTVSDDSLVCKTQSLRLPAFLTKTVRLKGNRLNLEYMAENLSPHTLPFQWAAHAIFAMHPGSRLEVPRQMNRIVNAYPGNRLTEAGREYSYPLPYGSSGFDLSRIPEFTSDGAQKYWFTDRISEGQCRLVHTKWNTTVTIDFPPRELPYLGIWVNEGGWNGGFNIGIEPSTCRGDNPVSAGNSGFGSVLPPRDTMTWNLAIGISVSD